MGTYFEEEDIRSMPRHENIFLMSVSMLESLRECAGVLHADNNPATRLQSWTRPYSTLCMAFHVFLNNDKYSFQETDYDILPAT
jgi:hypothetical protein